jgi:hypothetical protein
MRGSNRSVELQVIVFSGECLYVSFLCMHASAQWHWNGHTGASVRGLAPVDLPGCCMSLALRYICVHVHAHCNAEQQDGAYQASFTLPRVAHVVQAQLQILKCH